MIKEIQYTNIRRVLDNLHEHPLLADVTLEQAVRYAIRFLGLFGFPKMFQDRMEDVDIKDFRGLLPCDLVSIVQVKDLASGLCLRSMTDNFPKGMTGKEDGRGSHHGHDRWNRQDRLDGRMDMGNTYIPPRGRNFEEPSFKTQGRVIFTSFPEGCVEVAYKGIPVDEDGFPLLIDNENYLAALEAFIKKEVFTIKFDTGKINANVLQNAQQDYAFRAMELGSEFSTPSYSEAETLSRLNNTLLLNMRHFDNGFKHLGDREFLRRH